eukprot:Gregarina_sp_Pseudo_9__5518@NODE_71_length_4599_cov_21_528728_g65_i0_p1_GENE_NODE_71_length_4599_cov_21_528728_g65_i0NODE_71_length_4599_cov_21_528728_g65_i0_p1_ORF_typecomplete_len525_score209_64SBDS/PF01172_18/1_6e28SBDS/PF01172_18/7_8e02SBDS_C/PF09377_10/5_2e06Caldesmon/PF02029_15/1_1e05CDC27/PF09507_10/0_0071Borrelia_P83/PF05262_11/0_032AAA_23/PF13476_6/0_099DUF2459/PF09601_10/6_8e03DUF2459/PF09601_10/0_18Hamartin/PF04388_12/0_19AspBHydro_N/PF05279_11/5_3DUF4407/PF14362_6/9_3_NODE_71_length_
MLKINQPVNQIRLTNVAVVRLRQAGQRFEIACYPNKVRDWRAGIEKDVREVLQSHRIFVNVGKGEFARDGDLQACFGTNDIDKVSAVILNRGDVQLSARERQLVRDGFVKEVCSLTAERLVSLKTGLPLTPAMVENTAKQLRVLPKFKEGITSKAACARLIARLTAKLPEEIARAMLRADILHDGDAADLAAQLVKSFSAQIIHNDDLPCDDAKRKRVSFRVSTAEYQRLCDFVSQSLGANAELIVVSMLDKSAAVPPTAASAETASPVPPTTGGSEPKSDVAARSHGDGVSSSGDGDSSSSDESDESDAEAELISNGSAPKGGGRRGPDYSALISSEDDEDTETETAGVEAGSTPETEASKKATDVSAAKQKLSLEELKADLDKDTGSKEKRIRKVDLVEDTWSRKQQRKRQERREKERERKQAAEEAEAKQKAKAEELERRQEAERKQETASKIIVDGGPGWCVDCQVNYVTDLGQDLRQHYRMEWHTFNAKRRLRDKAPISRREFDELSRDIKEGFLAVTF